MVLAMTIWFALVLACTVDDMFCSASSMLNCAVWPIIAEGSVGDSGFWYCISATSSLRNVSLPNWSGRSICGGAFVFAYGFVDWVGLIAVIPSPVRSAQRRTSTSASGD